MFKGTEKLPLNAQLSSVHTQCAHDRANVVHASLISHKTHLSSLTHLFTWLNPCLKAGGKAKILLELTNVHLTDVTD